MEIDYTELARIKTGKPYYIVCILGYEFEGKIFKTGDLSMHSFGRNIPEGWGRATPDDIKRYYEIKKLPKG